MVDDVIGKLVADKYRIESLIRESASSDLFAARHEILDKPVTVKILPAALAIDTRWVKRFVEEARAASHLSHQNILNITDFGTDARGVSYAVYEPVGSGTLAALIAGERDIDEKRAANIARQIATAVSAAHEKQIIHGSLDPSNIFVDAGDSVKVYGFGADTQSVSRDADPRYLAPEQCSAYPTTDARSDVYSLGVIFFEMLAGVVPFDGSTASEVLAKQNSEPPPPLSAFRRDLRPEVEPIILSAMAADPERRYPTMAAFEEDVARLAGEPAAPEKVAAAAAGDVSRRNIWQTAFIVLAGITLLSGAFIYATRTRATDVTASVQAEPGSLPVQPIGPATGAQEESLAKLPALTDAEAMAAAMGQNPDAIPGGDGYNAWANGAIPPPGAPLNSNSQVPYGFPPQVQPGGQYYNVPQGGGSQFMPDDSGVVLRCKDVQTGYEIPCPGQAPIGPTQPKQTPTPKGTAANANVVPLQPGQIPAATPKPMATPLPKTSDKAQPGKDKPASPAAKPVKSPKPE